jgi:hypothetical protein
LQSLTRVSLEPLPNPCLAIESREYSEQEG